MDRVEWILMMHKQNLNGRETEDELFEAGIKAGIEETEEIMVEFGIFCLDYDYHPKYQIWVKREGIGKNRLTSSELLLLFNCSRTETVA
jgi:hypothetical protein